MKTIASIAAKYLVLYPIFWFGYLLYLATGHTPHIAYKSFRKLYCLTDGKLNDFLVAGSRRARPKKAIPNTKGVLGELAQNDIWDVVQDIRTSGFHVFKQKLPADICKQLQKFSEQVAASPVPHPGDGTSKVPYDRRAPVAPRYNFDAQTLAENSLIQHLITDRIFLAIAQEYLDCMPVLDLVTMWWSTVFRDQPSSEAAQLYHFDMDRPKFLKFFFYLTDVTSETGPHCYVKGSHKGLPHELRVNRRILDAEVEQCYRKEDLMEFTGGKGTILAADTRGLHKGKVLGKGERLIFQLEFSNNLFGAPYDRIAINSKFSEEFVRSVREFPFVYQLFKVAA